MTFLKSACALAAFAGAVTLLPAPPAEAGSCPGTVYRLSSNFNLAKGTGFLAIRSRPTSRSRMKGQLFNGNSVEVDRRRGNWIYIYPDN
ncbi:MAG: SH3 domain-containing protein, partial [Pseudomonadota bacterium]